MSNGQCKGSISILGQPNIPIWQLSGNQGQQWKNGQAPIGAQTKSYKIVFEGRRGNGLTGDIAIDDITFSQSTCGGILFCLQSEFS